MLRAGDLVLCAACAPAAGFAERAAAAAAAGFAGLSLFPTDYERARGEGLSDADLRRILSDHALSVAELDPLLRWMPETGLAGDATEEGAAFFRHGEDDFYRMADALGARSLNAVLYAGEGLPESAVTDAFAGLCERAAGHGLLVHLEFLPWTQVRDVEVALRIAERAGQPNGGVMLDTWHHFRSGVGNEALRAAAPRVFSVQISDAPAEAEPDPVAETLHRRLLPGEGAIDLRAILRVLREAGSPAPIGVEVFSDELATLPAALAARRAGDAARAVLAPVR
jgi:sugar phosphate isomerase/epimerase